VAAGLLYGDAVTHNRPAQQSSRLTRRTIIPFHPFNRPTAPPVKPRKGHSKGRGTLPGRDGRNGRVGKGKGPRPFAFYHSSNPRSSSPTQGSVLLGPMGEYVRRPATPGRPSGAISQAVPARIAKEVDGIQLDAQPCPHGIRQFGPLTNCPNRRALCRNVVGHAPIGAESSRSSGISPHLATDPCYRAQSKQLPTWTTIPDCRESGRLKQLPPWAKHCNASSHTTGAHMDKHSAPLCWSKPAFTAMGL
jgi:hypothetical protein